jgi:ribosomal protein S3
VARRGEAVARKGALRKKGAIWGKTVKCRGVYTEPPPTLIESVKTKSVYQSASLIAQDISFKLRNNLVSFRSIFSQIVKEIPLKMPKGVEGIRICYSGQLGDAE